MGLTLECRKPREVEVVVVENENGPTDSCKEEEGVVNKRYFVGVTGNCWI